jgi:peptidoglycan hydrolase-like protein with peptidoglycan-binding domain
MKIQTIQVRPDNVFQRGCLLLIALCTLAVAISAQTAATKLPPNARINKNEVIAVQVELRRLGLLNASITGKLDAETAEAVRGYQRQNSLPVTGRIDLATYEKLGLPYPAPDPDDPNVVERAGGAVKQGTALGAQKTKDAGSYVATKSKEGARYGLEKTWDAGAYAASKSKDAAKASVKGVKSGSRLGGRKTVSLIRRNDDPISSDLRELFFEHHEWTGVQYEVKDGMVTLKIPPKSKVDVGALVSEVRKVAGVRSVFVVVL